MCDFLRQEKYIRMFISEMGAKEVGNKKWNFRCPICGDSKKNRNKKRGYIFWNQDKCCFRYYCFNCGQSRSIEQLLKEISPDLYQQYRQEIFIKNKENNIIKPENFIPKNKIDKKGLLESKKILVNLSKLNNNHPAYKYMLSRKVPETRFNRVFWTDNFKELVEKTFPNKYNTKNFIDSGLVFILFDKNDYHVTGYQIRSIDPNVDKAKRFITCSENNNKGIFGIRELDKNKQIFVVEGIIDSLFIPNCVAVLNASVWSAGFENAIYFSDQEKRNKEVCKQIDKCISLGYKTVLIEDERYQNMDINDIVKTYNLSEKELLNLLTNNCYSGITAKVKFSKWRK